MTILLLLLWWARDRPSSRPHSNSQILPQIHTERRIFWLGGRQFSRYFSARDIDLAPRCEGRFTLQNRNIFISILYYRVKAFCCDNDVEFYCDDDAGSSESSDVFRAFYELNARAESLTCVSRMYGVLGVCLDARVLSDCSVAVALGLGGWRLGWPVAVGQRLGAYFGRERAKPRARFSVYSIRATISTSSTH